MLDYIPPIKQFIGCFSCKHLFDGNNNLHLLFSENYIRIIIAAKTISNATKQYCQVYIFIMTSSLLTSSGHMAHVLWGLLQALLTGGGRWQWVMGVTGVVKEPARHVRDAGEQRFAGYRCPMWL